MSQVSAWRDAAGDLLLGSCCAGCGARGRRLCRVCADTLRANPRPAWPEPVPPALRVPVIVPPYAGARYDGRLQHLLVAYKEEARHGLERPLGRMLADVVASALQAVVGPGPVALVPMPSAPGAVRRRGHDSVLRLARISAGQLRRFGTDATVRPLLCQARQVADQVGLSASDRVQNLQGALRARTGGGGRVLVVVDDVITTGASAAEAVSALRRAGLSPAVVATVAATPRRWPGAGSFG